MPFKVKEHFRKTKKGELRRVKESTRKDRIKKGLLVAGATLTTLGLGALAYKRLGSKLVKNAASISNKADDIATSKVKNITELLTPSKLTTSTSKYKTLPDPWLDEAVTVNKAKQSLTTGKKETKLLTSSRYQAETIPDPWNSSVKPKPKLKKKINKDSKETLALPGNKYKAEVIDDPWDDAIIKGSDKPLTVSKLKEKPLLLKKGKYNPPEYNAPIPSSDVTGQGKNLAAEIRSKRTLIKREPTDIKKANERLELAKKAKASDSLADQTRGANYERAAKERLTIINKRSPSKKQTGLVTTRGNASQSSVRHPYTKKSKIDSKQPKKKGKSRRDLLTGGKSAQELAENFIDSTVKTGIKKAGDNVADTIIPGSSQVGRTIRDIKGRVKQVEKLSNELAESGNKQTSRRGFLKKTVNKVAEEASLKPADAEKVVKGTSKRSKEAIENTLKSGGRDIENKYYIEPNRGLLNGYGIPVGQRIPKRVYRKSQGAAETMSQLARRFIRWKSGNHTQGRYY